MFSTGKAIFAPKGDWFHKPPQHNKSDQVGVFAWSKIMRSCISWNPFAQGTAKGALGLMEQTVEGLCSSLVSSALNSMYFEDRAVVVGWWHARRPTDDVQLLEQLQKKKAILQQKDQELEHLGKQLDMVKLQNASCAARLNAREAENQAENQKHASLQQELADLRKHLDILNQQNASCAGLLNASEAENKKHALLQQVWQKICRQPAAFPDENSTVCYALLLACLLCVCLKQWLSPSAGEGTNQDIPALLGEPMHANQVVEHMLAIRKMRRDEDEMVMFVENSFSSGQPHSVSPKRLTLFHFLQTAQYQLQQMQQTNNFKARELYNEASVCDEQNVGTRKT